MTKCVCSNCWRSKKRCDGESPCDRCTRYYRASTCSNTSKGLTVLGREMAMRVALGGIAQPSARLMFGLAHSMGHGHISINRSLARLMRIPAQLARAMIHVAPGPPFVHPDDRRQEALVMRWVGRNRQDAPIVRDIRMIRPVWKIDGLANKHMPIADDSRDPPVKYQQQCHTAHIQLLAETKGVYPDPRGGDTSVWGDDVVAPYEDLMVSSHDGFTLTLDRQAFPVAMMCDSAPTASDVSPHTASSRPGSISVALDTSARLGGSSGGTSAGSAGMGERGQRGGSGVEDHSRNSAHAADASDWLASAEMVESPLLCMPDSNNSHDVDGTFIASEAGIVADIGAAPSASVLRLPVPGGREASPSTHIPTPTSSGSAAGGLPSEVMEFEPDGATPHDHAVYSRLLRATLHQALSSTQQAALEYMHERLAGFEVIAQRFVCFPEYDDAGVLQAETRYCVGWTPVAEEVVDVQTATSRLLE